MDDPHDKLKRHVELMAECATWAFEAKEAAEGGDRTAADRYRKLAESFLKSAKELEP